MKLNIDVAYFGSVALRLGLDRALSRYFAYSA